jgi:hypothetical protein
VFDLTDDKNKLSADKSKKMVKRIDILEKKLEQYQKLYLPRDVTLTWYSPRKKETDDTPFITAPQTKVKAGGCAVSHDLWLDGWTFEKFIYLKSSGLGRFKINGWIDELHTKAFQINDLTSPDKTNWIDCFDFDTQRALKKGITKNVKAQLINI